MQERLDVRWMRRHDSFRKALATLTDGVELAATRPLSSLEEQGLIQGFEFTHELGWNLLKDYLEEKGFTGLIGSKDACRQAFRSGLIADGQAWMDMIKARNLSSHTYQEELARAIAEDIIGHFQPAFAALDQRFSAIRLDEAATP